MTDMSPLESALFILLLDESVLHGELGKLPQRGLDLLGVETYYVELLLLLPENVGLLHLSVLDKVGAVAGHH